MRMEYMVHPRLLIYLITGSVNKFYKKIRIKFPFRDTVSSDTSL